MTPTPGRRLPAPPFAGDDGSPDPRLAAALEAYASGPGAATRTAVVGALAGARVLVPVVAVLDEGDPGPDGGPPAEKASHMASVSTTGRDGRRGLLAFSGLASLRRWDALARPVPVGARDAAQAALADGADALVLDLAGPVTVAVEGAALRWLAGR